MKKRALSVIMAIVMIFSIMPLSIFTAEAVIDAPVITFTAPDAIELTSAGQIPAGKVITFASDRALTSVTFSYAGGVDVSGPSQSGNTYTLTTKASTPTAGANYVTFTATYVYNGKTYTKSAYSVLETYVQAQVYDNGTVKFTWKNSWGMNKKLYYGHANAYITLVGSTGGSKVDVGTGTHEIDIKDSTRVKSYVMNKSTAPMGTYYIDTSVYSRLQDVPNMSLTVYHDPKDDSGENQGGGHMLITGGMPTVTGDSSAFSLTPHNTTDVSFKTSTVTYSFSGNVPSETISATFAFTLNVDAGKSGETAEIHMTDYINISIVPYNKANLRQLVQEEDVLSRQSRDYSAGWDEYAAAYRQAQVVLKSTVTNQYEVDEAYNDLLAAVTTLKQNGVYCDYTAVENAIAYAESILKTNFNDYAPVQAAIDAVNWELVNTPENVATVAQYAQNIYDAVRANLKDANYSAVNVAISNVPADIDATYTATCPQHTHTTTVYYYDSAKRAALKKAVDDVDWTKKLDEQATITGYANAINNAINALTEGKANYKYVDEMNHPDYDRMYYTTDSLAAYDQAVAAISVNRNLLAHDQATVNNYAVQYYNAKSLLKTNNAKYPGDYSGVDTAIRKAPANYETIYTAETVAVLKNAINSVDYNLSSVEQDIIDGYERAILDAIGALVVGPGNFTEVEKAIAEANKLNPDNYYDFSFVTEAINAVDYTKKANEQGIIDGYAADIRNAIAALIAKPADYTNVNAAKAQIPATLKMFTAESVEHLNEVLASTPSNLTILEQARVNAYAESILSAIAALVPSAVATLSLSTDKSSAARDEEITVTCKLNTTYNIGMSQFIIFYDKTQLEVVGSGKEAITACSELTANGSITASTVSPEQQYPETFTPEQKSQYGMVIVRFSPFATATALPMFTTTKDIFSFKLKVRDDITKTTTARIFMSNDTLGKNVYCYYKDTAVASESATTMSGMVYSMTNADLNVIINYTPKEEPADYTAVNEAIAKIPADMSGYTEESVTKVRNAVNAVNWNLLADDQAIVDGYATAINNAVKDLEEKPETADYTELDAIVEYYRGLDLSSVSTNLVIRRLMNNIETSIAGIDWTLDVSEQETVDGYVTDIQTKIDALMNAIKGLDMLTAAKDSIVINEEKNFISGYEEGIVATDVDESVTAGQGITKKIVTTANGTGTGTKVETYLGEELLAEYAVVVYGDLNGDAWIDANDVRTMRAIIKNPAAYENTAVYEAADVDHNGAVNNDDLTLLNNAVKFGAVIAQRKDV